MCVCIFTYNPCNHCDLETSKISLCDMLLVDNIRMHTCCMLTTTTVRQYCYLLSLVCL